MVFKDKISGLLVVIFLSSHCCNAQIISTFAGNGIAGDTGDGEPATNASIISGFGAWDKLGNYYFSERGNHKVRKVDALGIISRVAGTGIAGSNGDNGSALDAEFNNPIGVAVDGNNNVYVCDLNNNKIRKINTATGIITTIAGNGIAGFSGNNGPATLASLNGPTDICIDPAGNIYVSDRVNRIIRKINIAGIISVFAGTYNEPGYDGDGGPATLAKLAITEGLCSDKYGNIFIVNGDKVRKVDAVTGIISTVAGIETSGYSGDGGMATSAKLFKPFDVAVDKSNNVFISDCYNHRVRKVNTSGVINTVAGNGTATFEGDNELATAAKVNLPQALALDSCGNLYISDVGNYRIRKIAYNPTCEPTEVDAINAIKTSLTTYPNPTSSTLTLTSTEKINTISITNAIGQVVYEQQYADKERVEINVGHLPQGVYMVRVNGVYVRRFLKE